MTFKRGVLGWLAHLIFGERCKQNADFFDGCQSPVYPVCKSEYCFAHCNTYCGCQKLRVSDLSVEEREIVFELRKGSRSERTS